jgi:hypothetical protein
MKFFLFFTPIAFVFSACIATNNAAVLDSSNQSQAALRNYQSRVFDTKDVDNVIRNVIATMQDLGFIIDKADKDLGTVSGYSFSSQTNLTVTVRARANQTVVRANAQYNLRSITNPQTYQNFFNALSQSLFLAANEVL